MWLEHKKHSEPTLNRYMHQLLEGTSLATTMKVSTKWTTSTRTFSKAMIMSRPKVASRRQKHQYYKEWWQNWPNKWINYRFLVDHLHLPPALHHPPTRTIPTAGNVSYVAAQTTTRLTVPRHQCGTKKSQQKVNHKKRRLKGLSTSTVANVIDVMVFGLKERAYTQQKSTSIQEIATEDHLQHQQLQHQNQKQDWWVPLQNHQLKCILVKTGVYTECANTEGN